MTDEKGIEAAIKRIHLLRAATPTIKEQEILKNARKKMREVNAIDSEAEQICNNMFKKYPLWCQNLSEQEQEKGKGV